MRHEDHDGAALLVIAAIFAAVFLLSCVLLYEVAWKHLP